MAIAKECADSTHEVSRGEVAGGVNTSCRRDERSRRDRGAEKPSCDLTGLREGAERGVVEVSLLSKSSLDGS